MKKCKKQKTINEFALLFLSHMIYDTDEKSDTSLSSELDLDCIKF